jgi:hypothetical protein
MAARALIRPPEPTYVFPPALVALVRERLAPRSECLPAIDDEELVRLLTTVFFAGLETYEGQHYPIGVTFIGKSGLDFVLTEDTSGGVLPLYRWKILRFASPLPFVSRELVKLAVAGADRRIYSAVGVLADGTLAITGLAREGSNAGPNPFVKIIASRPGCLSIRSGRDLVIEYERGAILTVGDEEVFSSGSVHRALTTIARNAGVDDEVVPQYLEAVGFLVREVVAHGRGGILIISGDEQPSVAESASYKMVLDSSLAVLLRLAWRVGLQPAAKSADRRDAVESNAQRSGHAGPGRPDSTAFATLLRNAFLMEAERVVEELGRLTAIDGAVILNRELALVAFGVILPVGQPIAVEQVSTQEEGHARLVDFGRRGTRHRAGATYAAAHPGSVVFVASEDGQVSCILRERPKARVRLWRLAAERAHVA